MRDLISLEWTWPMWERGNRSPAHSCGGAVLVVMAMAVVGLAPVVRAEETAATLDGTASLQLHEPLDVVMVRGISLFAEREIERVSEARRAEWLDEEDGSGGTQAERVEAARERLRSLIGAVDPFVEDGLLWQRPVDLPESTTSVTNLRWDVLEGVSGEGLQFRAAGAEASPVLILIPDADESPEQYAGWLGAELPRANLVKRCLEAGVEVICPAMISRSARVSGHPDIRWTNLPHREFVYRAGFNLGRHIIGYEVQKVRALAMRLKREQPDRPVWLMGVGEGGLIALFAGAADGESIDAVAVCGYFNERDGVWQEPIYRNVWRQLVEFGDAELASLIAPRPLVIEQGVAPEVDGPPAAAEGQQAYAAPGAIVSPAAESVRAEFARAQSYFEALGARERIQLVESGANPVGSSEVILALVSSARSEVEAPTSVNVPAQVADPDAIAARDTRQVAELIRHTQRTLHRSDKVRERIWREADRSSVEAWEESTERYRDFVHDGFIGRLPVPDSPLNVRSRLVIDEPTYVGYEIVFDVIPPAAPPSGQEADWGVIAGGILLVPKHAERGAKRPVVVCQHGLEGVPMDTITTDQSERAWRAYKGFSTTLVRRGFIVYAPQNPYRGFDAFRVLQRKSNPVGRSLFSYIIEQHRRTLDWLASLPVVDSQRIGFYGLSYGGKTAVRVPPLLPPDENNVGYCLSICSADFNEWIRKNASTEDRYSYVLTREYEIFEWNMGHIAGYAELSSLMAPRPFMVERGHHDGVAPDEWVGWEFARVRRHYDLLGIGDRTEIEWFVGPHTINGDGTFDFLHRHLNWPQP